MERLRMKREQIEGEKARGKGKGKRQGEKTGPGARAIG